MARIDYDYYEDQAALADEYAGGCLPFAALLPILVVVFGILMTLVLTKIEFDTSKTDLQVDSGTTGIKLQSKIAPLFTPEVQEWGEEITEWSGQHGLDPNLVATVMQIESCGDPKAVSSAGAMGLFQVMPFHFSAGEDPYTPSTNAYRGLAYLKSALEARGGEVRLGLAGYNGGIGGTQRPESSWPAETLRYVYWGTGIYKDAQKGKGHSDRLDEWLGRGGASLCAQAANHLGIVR